MKDAHKTKFSVCVGKKSGYDVYRVVYVKFGHFYVKWNGNIVNVDDDMHKHNFVHTDSLR